MDRSPRNAEGVVHETGTSRWLALPGLELRGRNADAQDDGRFGGLGHAVLAFR